MTQKHKVYDAEMFCKEFGLTPNAFAIHKKREHIPRKSTYSQKDVDNFRAIYKPRGGGGSPKALAAAKVDESKATKFSKKEFCRRAVIGYSTFFAHRHAKLILDKDEYTQKDVDNFIELRAKKNSEPRTYTSPKLKEIAAIETSMATPLNKMEIIYYKPNELKGVKFNPPNRIKEIRESDLYISIKKHGIRFPIGITKDKKIADGHRRHTCATLLGIQVPTVLMDSDMSVEDLFEDANTTAMRLTNKDAIYIYINGGKVAPRIQLIIKEIEQLVGKPNLEKLGAESASPFILRYAKTIAIYCKENNDKKFLSEAIMWMVNQKMTFAVRRAMENNVDYKVIKNAIKEKRPLKQTFQ